MILNVSLSGFSPSSVLELFDMQHLRYDVDHLLRPKVKSKQKPCFISCRTFLDLALPLHKPDGFKLDSIRKLLDSGQKLQSIPMLYTLESEYSKSSTIHVVGHEGRHRALVCLERGYEFMPLMLHGCRWSEQDTECYDRVPSWPTHLQSEDGGMTIKFPFSRAQAYLPMAQCIIK